MHMRFGILLLGIIAVLSTETALKAHAQVSGPPPQVLSLPPANIDVLNSSAADNAKYHIPPMPDQLAAPEAFEQWNKAVAYPLSLPHSSDTTATVTAKPNKFHGAAKTAGSFASTANSVLTGASYNWSGPVVYNNTQAPFNTASDRRYFCRPDRASGAWYMLGRNGLLLTMDRF